MPQKRCSRNGMPAASAPKAPLESSTTLYQARLHVRLWSETNPGMTACSSAKAALRSVPIPLSMPTKAIGASSGTPAWKTKGRAPSAVSKERANSVRLLPRRSALIVTTAVAAAAPAKPAAITMPIAVVDRPSRYRNTPSTTPSRPIPNDRSHAAAQISAMLREVDFISMRSIV